jgi:hypothetical protein
MKKEKISKKITWRHIFISMVNRFDSVFQLEREKR